MTEILDGRPVAAAIKHELQSTIAAMASPPSLAILQVGTDPSAAWYVRSIKRATEGVGMRFHHVHLPQEVDQRNVIGAVQQLSADATISGIIVQLPLPPNIDANLVIAALDPRKDVDGLHPLNAGRLTQGLPSLLPNTPAGGIELLHYYGLPIAGQQAVVVGRSNVVGKPMALLLLQEQATVTICHSHTPDLPTATRSADLLVVAIGRPAMVTGAMIKPGATVIDFGINERDGKVVGDVEWSSAVEVAGAITPVPGGTGPMTNALLLRNTLAAHLKLQQGE
ncbi:MAG: bifunctional 5,10-methylenetetrahydrofolate dehydrogenase/5,10-methenyltetrahydrofolate cyclohydrolase [Herpetosiphonaceae bacterium]|nr:bifunctional 5,10-methylenetetrahydrofolate dehydrogenase/5,10-methenyltetrahydrofolate cyclohydrolase [Herpetosiphonaceae bacterium]